MSTATKDIAFVLVPGGFCPASLWDKLAARLKSLGYSVAQSENPSLALKEEGFTPVGLYADAENARSLARSFIDHGKSVIIVGNSYGGFVSTEATKGLSKAELGISSGACLVHLVLLSSLLAPLGITIDQLLHNRVDGLDISASGAPAIDPPPIEMRAALFSHVESEDERMRYAADMRPQCPKAFAEPLTHVGWKHVPTTVVLPEEDQILPPAFQHENVDKGISEAKGNVRKLCKPFDHCSMVAHEEEVAAILVGIAEGRSIDAL